MTANDGTYNMDALNNPIINTTQQAEADPLLLLTQLMGNPSRGIEAMERAGQRELLASDTIPTTCRGATQEQLESLGFRFPDKPTGDDLFRFALLPDGWKKERSDHDMGSYLVDAKGRRRAAIFYKAAFYDRRADMRLDCFWRLDYYVDTGKTYTDARGYERHIFASQITNADGFQSELYANQDDAADWIKARYPDYRNPFAYWSQNNE